MSMRVADWLAEYLAQREIRHIFGIIGAGNVRIFDAIAKKGYTEIVCVHHEQAACMAMQTYYRTSGKITASLLTTGGGSSNGVTGVLSAWADSIPGVIISGNEASKHTRPDNPLRMWGVQGYDSSDMVRKICKRVSRLMDPKDIRRELEESFRVAGSGRPGPVWLDIPMDLQSLALEPQSLPLQASEADTGLAPSASQELDKAIAQSLEMLRKSERPVLWLGHGIRLAKAEQLILPLLESLKAPSLVSWAGIDMVDSSHPLVHGRAGVYGQRNANFVLQNADLVLAIGTRLALPQIGYDLSEFARAAKTIVVDIDPTEFDKLGSRGTLAVCADAGAFMKGLLEAAKKEKFDFGPWRERCDGYRKKYPWVDPARGHADSKGFMNSYTFMEKLNAHFKKDQVVVTDMGTALLSGHQVLKFKEGQRLITSTGLGEMGYGLPGAIGASFARNKGEVLCLNCDGGMMMNLQELQTMAHHQLPIKLLVFNNDGYLMIKHTQKSLFGSTPYVGTNAKSGISCPDFSKLAAAFGFPAFQIRSWGDFEKVMPQVQKHEGPLICEVFMDPEQPFVPKQSVAPMPDGSLVSPPLEDLSPLLPRAELEEAMIVGLHPKSKALRP
jgi:acetolactate synthase-1/2/3 large subunit